MSNRTTHQSLRPDHASRPPGIGPDHATQGEDPEYTIELPGGVYRAGYMVIGRLTRIPEHLGSYLRLLPGPALTTAAC